MLTGATGKSYGVESGPGHQQVSELTGKGTRIDIAIVRKNARDKKNATLSISKIGCAVMKNVLIVYIIAATHRHAI